MWRLLAKFVIGVRSAFQALMVRVFNKYRDNETGKLRGINPATLRKIGLIVLFGLFVLVMVTRLFSNNAHWNSALDDYKKELQTDKGTSARPIDKIDDFRDPLEFSKRRGTGPDYTTSSPSSDKKDAPGAIECAELVERVKKGTSLSADDKTKINRCIDSNPMALTNDELAMLKSLVNDNLSAKEAEMLRRALRGDADGNEEMLARHLPGMSEEEREMLKNALDKNNQEILEAMAQKMGNMPLSADQKTALEEFKKSLLAQMGGNNPAMGASKEEIMKQLMGDVAKRESELQALRDQVARAQAAAAEAGKKIGSGRPLSAEESKRLQALAELQKRLEEAERLQNERKKSLVRVTSDLQKSLAEVALTMQEVLPSGVEAVYDDAPVLDCKDIKKLPIKRIKKVKPGLKTPSGKPLDKGDAKLVQLYRKKRIYLTEAKKKVTSPTAFEDMGEGLDPVVAMGGQNQAVDAKNLVFFTDKAAKQFTFSPDTKIPAVMESMILVSSKNPRGQIIRARILDDVYADNGALAIPKNSIVVGTTNGFDDETGIGDVTLDKVAIGSGKTIVQKFTVGSGDGQPGLKGEVRDTRGKYLLGAFVTAFSAGALNWFSQQVVQPFQTSTSASDAMVGASLGGGAEVMGKISELFASDLQNAAKIFYCPRGVPIVLFPTE